MKKLSTATLAAVIAALLVVTAAFAAFINGNFEAGNFSGWTGPADMPVAPETVFLDTGLTGAQPFGWASIARGAGGVNLSGIVTSGTDPNTNNAINMVHNGTYAARVNSQDSYSGAGHGANANSIRQTFTVDSGDVQLDGSIHLAFSYAPVMVDPGHPPSDQPYFFVGVRNLTTGKTLYEVFSLVNQAGYPWVAGAAFSVGGTWYYMPWQEVDLVSTAANPKMSVGDSIEIEVIASGCSLTGHPGYVYVDDFGFTIPSGCSPTLSTIAPISGPIAGGTQVTITGTNLNTVTALYVGTNSILSAAFVTQTATSIVFNTPSGSAGYTNVTVVNPCGSASFFNGFQYNTPNTAPVAVRDVYFAIMSTPFTPPASALANDTDADLDPLTAILVSGPSHAAPSSFTFNSDGTFTYRAENGYKGVDRFTYKANDGTADSNSVTVNINIRPRTMVLRSAALFDGWVLESTQSSNVGQNIFSTWALRVGDEKRNQQYRSFMHFNTKMSANIVFVSAALKLKSIDVVGDPFTGHGDLLADVKMGTFGNNILESSDFQASSTQNNIGSLSASLNGWYQIILDPSKYQYLDRTGVTQMRLRFALGDDNDNTTDFIRFNGGEIGLTTRPQIVIRYYIPYP